MALTVCGEIRLVQMLIEQLALRAALHQVLELLLTVNLDQELGELAQCLHRHQLAVDIGARAAVRADHAPHDDLTVVLDRLRLEPAQRPLGQRREAGGNFGALGAVAHDVARPAASGNRAAVRRPRWTCRPRSRPVRAVSPGPNSSSASSTMTRSRNCRCVSMAASLQCAASPWPCPRPAVAAAAPVQLRAQQPVVVVARRDAAG